MEPSRLETLISLFSSLENRRKTSTPDAPPPLLEQTEEAYQWEQAEWLAAVKKRRGKSSP